MKWRTPSTLLGGLLLGWVAPYLIGSATGLGFAQIVEALLGLSAAWVVSVVEGKRSSLMVGVAMVLCFTGAAAVRLHGVTFDPSPPALALALGALVAVLMPPRGARARVVNPLAGVMSAAAVAKIFPLLGPKELAWESRQLWLLGIRCGGLEAKVEAFRERATALLLTRQALLIPTAGDTLWAAFGLPLAADDAGGRCVETAELVRTALTESFPVPAQFHFTVLHGAADSGMKAGMYLVAGGVLVQGAAALAMAGVSSILTDTATAKLLGEAAAPQGNYLELRPLMPTPPPVVKMKKKKGKQ